MNAELLAKAKSLGFSDRQIAHLTGRSEDEVRAERKKLGLVPSYRLVVEFLTVGLVALTGHLGGFLSGVNMPG